MTRCFEGIPVFLKQPKDQTTRIGDGEINEPIGFQNSLDLLEGRYGITDMFKNVAESHDIEEFTFETGVRKHSVADCQP